MITVGIIGNIHKEHISDISNVLIEVLRKAKIPVIASGALIPYINDSFKISSGSPEMIGEQCDIIISVGGDGTLLASSLIAYHYDKPIVGLNLGKLGFLAELTTDRIKNFIDDLKDGAYTIEERIVLNGTIGNDAAPLIAFNDLVIDKGGWPKMIDISLSIDNEYVTTFSADGLIIATPAGSTGYSLSTGGPIVTPNASVITLSPISAHSLTIRPLVINAVQEVAVEVRSPRTDVQINCDGQRVNAFTPPMILRIRKSDHPLKLLRSKSFSYFQVLREKLLWGVDYRHLNNKEDFEK